VLTADTSPKELHRTSGYYLRRLALVPKVLLAMLLARRRGARSLYLAVDGGAGLVLNAGYVAFGRVLRYDMTLHHRSFQYLDRGSLSMRALCRAAGYEARHAFLCESMRTLFEQRYGAVQSMVVSNSATLSVPVAEVSRSRTGSLSSRRVHIGFLSNVSFDKGLDTFVEAALALQAQGWTVTATVAGSASDKDAEQYLQTWLAARPDVFSWVGALDGASAKVDFLDAQDVLIFPTRYRNEAQPNVVLEAMARGLPVVATRCGCLGSDVSSAAGVLLESGSHLAASIAEAVTRICRSEQVWTEYSRAALTSVRADITQAERQLDHLLSHLR
jgi:glycosyltransferase involved in cell wall biosynthesis